MSHSTGCSLPVAGLDVHAASVSVAIVRGDELLSEVRLPYDPEQVAGGRRRWGAARACYEAGATGFGLARHLREAGLACDVVAPGLVPKRATDRVKTDRRDARKLALLYQGGMLTPVWVPSAEQEAVRDLLRACEDARQDRARARQRLGKFLLRTERHPPGASWGVSRRQWLGRQAFEHPARQAAYDDYLLTCDLADRRIEALEREIAGWAEHEELRALVGRLRCLRGVDTLTALGLVAEIGDFARFASAPAFMAYLGLAPSQSSSGERSHRGAITRTGNTHARRMLIEAAHNQRRRPARSAHLVRRQAGQPAPIVESAQRAQLRLHRRWQRMSARGKHSDRIAAAVARELAGFVWAIATDQPLRMG